MLDFNDCLWIAEDSAFLATTRILNEKNDAGDIIETETIR